MSDEATLKLVRECVYSELPAIAKRWKTRVSKNPNYRCTFNAKANEPYDKIGPPCVALHGDVCPVRVQFPERFNQ